MKSKSWQVRNKRREDGRGRRGGLEYEAAFEAGFEKVVLIVVVVVVGIVVVVVVVVGIVGAPSLSL